MTNPYQNSERLHTLQLNVILYQSEISAHRQTMPEPESTHIETGKPQEPTTPTLGDLGLTEELARRAFRELPHGGDNAFILLQSLGLDKAGSSPESTVAAVAIIRLARDKIVGLVNADGTIPPENKPAAFRVNLKHLFQIQSDETSQQRFIKLLEFVLADDK